MRTQKLLAADRVVCPKCNGLGCIPLGEHLVEVLRLLTKAPSKTAALYKALGLTGTITQINNRCTDLLALGLVHRYREGKAHVYAITARGMVALRGAELPGRRR